jgi:hypothetical protein
MGGRFPGGQYRHQYGDLLVTVESRHGVYVATVSRPSDGYEVTIETPERHPSDAARYALGLLAHGEESENIGLRRAAEEIGQEAKEALAEDSELSGPKRDGGNMVVYVVTYYDGNTMPGEVEFWINKTQAGARKKQAEVIKAHLDDVQNPRIQGQIVDALDGDDVEQAAERFAGDGGPTGMQACDITKVDVGK